MKGDSWRKAQRRKCTGAKKRYRERGKALERDGETTVEKMRAISKSVANLSLNSRNLDNCKRVS